MEQEKKSTAIYWIGFLVSSGIFAWMIATHNEWLTLMLPFVATFFVKAMRIM